MYGSGGWGRDRTVDLTIFSRTLVPTELPSRIEKHIATQTGLAPATSAVTGRRANQLRYWAKTLKQVDENLFSFTWRPQRDLNPCYRRERAMS